jgi:uracil-DNA glycosylase
MTKARVRLEPGWKTQLQSQFDEPYMVQLRTWLLERAEAGAEIYPPPKQWFSAFDMTPFADVKIVILGQDPYHGPGQAHGLCFSVQPGVRIPPSLINIYKELRSDLGIEPASHGYLESWARQGVFLLNSVLTVERGQAAAHQNKGWEQFTDVVIDKLANNTDNTVFLLWGGYARKKGQMIDGNRHLVLECAHPSPLSVRGFTGCRHFSKANAYLEKHGKTPIDWQLPEAVTVS